MAKDTAPAVVAAALELAEADYQHEMAAFAWGVNIKEKNRVLREAGRRHAEALAAYKKATGRADG